MVFMVGEELKRRECEGVVGNIAPHPVKGLTRYGSGWISYYFSTTTTTTTTTTRYIS